MSKKPYRPNNKYEVVAVRARPVNEVDLSGRIDVSRCHPAEQDKVAKIARAYMEFGGFNSELKAEATDGKGHTILSIMPWRGEFSAPTLARTFHRRNNDTSNLDYDSILDTRIVPLTGEVRVIIQKTAQTAVSEDRKQVVAPNPMGLFRASAKRLKHMEDNDEEAVSYMEAPEPSEEERGGGNHSEAVSERSEGGENDNDGPIDYRRYNKLRPYIPKRR